jgi:hypothetical protein
MDNLTPFVGWTGSGSTNTVERYDPIKDTWTDVAKMQKERRELCACVVEDQFIYVFGGLIDGDSATDSIEKYDAV